MLCHIIVLPVFITMLYLKKIFIPTSSEYKSTSLFPASRIHVPTPSQSDSTSISQIYLDVDC